MGIQHTFRTTLVCFKHSDLCSKKRNFFALLLLSISGLFTSGSILHHNALFNFPCAPLDWLMYIKGVKCVLPLRYGYSFNESYFLGEELRPAWPSSHISEVYSTTIQLDWQGWISWYRLLDTASCWTHHRHFVGSLTYKGCFWHILLLFHQLYLCLPLCIRISMRRRRRIWWICRNHKRGVDDHFCNFFGRLGCCVRHVVRYEVMSMKK